MARVWSYQPHDLALRRAVMPQQSLLQFAFTVREVVEMGRTPHDDTAEDCASNVERALERTEMPPFADRIYPSLSGGEKARAQLGRVLAQETPLLLARRADRLARYAPSAARDAPRAGRRGRKGGSVVAVVHDLNLAASTAHRIALLHRGRIVADGAPWVVMERAAAERGLPMPDRGQQAPDPQLPAGPAPRPKRRGSHIARGRMLPPLDCAFEGRADG